MSDRMAYFRAYDSRRRTERAARWIALRPEREKLNAKYERWCRCAGHERPGRHAMCASCRQQANAECRQLAQAQRPKREKPPAGMCECGCGQPTKRAGQTKAAQGWKKGDYVRFLPGHNRKRWRQSEAIAQPVTLADRLAYATARVEQAERAMWQHPNDALYATALLARRAERDEIKAVMRRQEAAA